MAKRKQPKRTYSWSFVLLIIAIFILGLIIIFWSIKRPFCANTLSCKESLSLNVVNDEVGEFNGQKIIPPKIDLSAKEPSRKVLGQESGIGEKHIYVDLATQTLKAYQGDELFMTALVSTGKWGKTPTGEFTIWEKLRATKMSGGSGADYYYLPNVPFVMFFSNDQVSAGRGFSLHGAYWHNNFGHPMSHGCVNMRTIDAEKLYHWVNPIEKGNVTAASIDDPGTKITIYGESN